MQRFIDAIKDHRVNLITHYDPDGLLAAAICTRALHALGANDDDIDFIYESPSAVQQGKSRFLDPNSDDFVGGFIILLDLPYSPEANVWIDHHASELDVKPGGETIAFVQDTSKSAAALTHDFFKNTMKVQDKLCDPAFLDFVDARDTGRAPRTITKEFEAISLAVHEDRDDYGFFSDIVERLIENPDPRPIASDPRVVIKSKKERKRINRGVELLRGAFVANDKAIFFTQVDIESDKPSNDPSKKRVFLYNQFMLFDFSDIDNPEKDRAIGAAIPYYLIEQELKGIGQEFSFLLTFRGDDKTGEIHATISINQAKENVVKVHDVGQFAKQHGGGGHRFVAGFIIPPDAFVQTISAVMAFFNVA